MDNLTETKLKYLLAGIIWLGVFVLAGLMITSGTLSTVNGGNANFLMGGALFIGAALATGAMFNWGMRKDDPKAHEDVALEKRKNDQRGIDPMSLLTEEDIVELRQQIKQDVRRRLMQDGDEGEFTSIEALLAEQDQFKRR